MFYRPFDRSMGLWIINEFLKDFKSLGITCFRALMSGTREGCAHTLTVWRPDVIERVKSGQDRTKLHLSTTFRCTCIFSFSHTLSQTNEAFKYSFTNLSKKCPKTTGSWEKREGTWATICLGHAKLMTSKYNYKNIVLRRNTSTDI